MTRNWTETNRITAGRNQKSGNIFIVAALVWPRSQSGHGGEKTWRAGEGKESHIVRKGQEETKEAVNAKGVSKVSVGRPGQGSPHVLADRGQLGCLPPSSATQEWGPWLSPPEGVSHPAPSPAGSKGPLTSAYPGVWSQRSPQALISRPSRGREPTVQGPLSIHTGWFSTTPMETGNWRMLKSPIQKDVVFTYNLHISSSTLFFCL